jgi:hypothetical protein
MTGRRSVLAVAAVALLLVASPSGARQSADHQKAAALIEGLRARVPEAIRELGWLQNSIPRAGAIPADVIDGLQELHDAAFTAFKLPDAERQRFLELAKADIVVKAEYCRKHPQGMAALVDVTVHTWRPSVEPRVEAKQWNVVYLSAPLAVFADRKGKAFPGFSSPSKRALPPGNYVVWAEDPADASRRGPRKEIQVGDPTTTLTAPVVVDILIAPGRQAPRDRP